MTATSPAFDSPLRPIICTAERPTRPQLDLGYEFRSLRAAASRVESLVVAAELQLQHGRYEDAGRDRERLADVLAAARESSLGVVNGLDRLTADLAEHLP